VALSFAGAQREYVESVARELQARGVRYLYDADEEIGLWGKHLTDALPWRSSSGSTGEPKWPAATTTLACWKESAAARSPQPPGGT
jgi:hypothetical protein